VLTVPEGEMPGSPDGQRSGSPDGQSPPPPWPGQMIELPTGPVYIRIARPAGTASDGDGDGPVEPVLLVHGLGGSSTNWTDLMECLAATQRLSCTAVDLPGFGFSPPPPDADYTIQAQARAVISLLEHLGQAPVHVVGNSMGGTVLTKVAAQRPDLIGTLTLISPALPDLRPRLLPLRLAVVAAPGVGRVLLDRIARQPAAARTDLSVRELYRDPLLMHPLRRDQEVAEVARRDELDYANDALRLSARSLVAEYLRLGRRSLWRDAEAVAAPALVVHGSADRLVNPVMAVKAARSFAVSRVVILAAVGHVAMMEQPQAVAAEIQSFRQWVRRAQAGPGRSGGGKGDVTGRQALNRVRC
jgi:pimeloyl-ACP methyl ester carboxylesterase